MSSEVPPEFDKSWSMSDVVLHTNNSDGKEIHACKAVIASFSPYFRALFFGDFKEKNEATVNVDCDYDVMLEILKNIYQIDFEYAVGQKPYSSEMIVKMYKAADLFDFVFIRKLCVDQMEGYPNVEMAIAASDLELFDLRMKIWMKLTREELYKFLHSCDYKYSVSKEEFRILFEKVVGLPLPSASEPYCKEVLNLEQITEDLENPRVDLTKSWPGADLAIITAESRGRVLYAKKSVVEMMCNNLNKYLCSTDKVQLEDPKDFLARIKEHYITVKEILSLIHHCNTNFRNERVLHPALLYDMYCLSREEFLDIPFVKDWCVAQLIEHKSVDAVDVLATMGLMDNLKEALEMLSISDLRDWIQLRDEHLSYQDGSMNVAITLRNDDRKINAELTSWLIQKFKKRVLLPSLIK